MPTWSYPPDAGGGGGGGGGGGAIADLNGIVSGEIVEQVVLDQTYRTISLRLAFAGVFTNVANQNLVITPNVSGNLRIDLIQWNGAVLSVKAGVPGANPDCPVPDVGNIPIAVVNVPDAFPTARNMNTNSSVLAVITAYYYAFGGLFASRVSTNSQTVGAEVDLSNLDLRVYFPKAGFGYAYSWQALATNSGAKVNSNWRYSFDDVSDGNEMGNSFEDGSVDPRQGLISYRVMIRVGGVGQSVQVGSHRLKPRLRAFPVAPGYDVTTRMVQIVEVN